MKSTIVFLIIFNVPISLFGFQKDSSEVKAEQIIREFVRARELNQFDKMARLFHPESLGEFKKYLISLSKGNTGLIRSFGISDSTNGISTTDSISLMANYFRSATSSLYPPITTGCNRLIGSIHEGQDTIHVLLRNDNSIFGFSLIGVEVVTLRKTSNSYGMLLPDQLVMYFLAVTSTNNLKK